MWLEAEAKIQGAGGHKFQSGPRVYGEPLTWILMD